MVLKTGDINMGIKCKIYCANIKWIDTYPLDKIGWDGFKNRDYINLS